MISMSVERAMFVQAVIDGQIGAEHVSVDELLVAHHALADAVIAQTMSDTAARPDVQVFDHDWQWLTPN